MVSCILLESSLGAGQQLRQQGTQKVLVEGRFRGHSYTAQDGTEKFVNEVMANRVVFLSGQGQAGGGVTERNG